MTLDASQSAPASRKSQIPAAAGRGRIRYSRALAARICRRLADGASLRAIANDPGMPARSTLRYWIERDEHGLFAQCRRPPKAHDPRTLFTQELAEEICRELASGRSLNSIAGDPGMPAACTVFNWARKDAGFGAAYARARAIGYEALADEILDIADNPIGDRRKMRGRSPRLSREDLDYAKMRIAARQWLFTVARPNHERSRREPLQVKIVRFGEEAETSKAAQAGLPPDR